MLDSLAFTAARKAKGMSQKELAAAAGVTQQMVASIETGTTRTTRFVLRFAKALDVPPERLDPEWANADEARPPGGFPGSSTRRDLSIVASQDAGGGFITVVADPVDFIPRPPLVAQVRGAYGLIVAGETMAPELEPGDIALVNPNLPPMTDATFVFYAVPRDELRATIRRLRRATSTTWHLRQWNPPDRAKADFTLSRKEWPIAHRVVGKYSRG
jgi:transcriptional regulator with XRE-family HTH domain